MDAEILELRRKVVEEDDPQARFRYRIACVRNGRLDLAGIQVKDIVLVNEKESPWIKGRWRGQLLRLFEGGHMYVNPLDSDIKWRYKPCSQYRLSTLGIYLTPKDEITLLEPAAPGV